MLGIFDHTTALDPIANALWYAQNWILEKNVHSVSVGSAQLSTPSGVNSRYWSLGRIGRSVGQCSTRMARATSVSSWEPLRHTRCGVSGFIQPLAGNGRVSLTAPPNVTVVLTWSRWRCGCGTVM